MESRAARTAEVAAVDQIESARIAAERFGLTPGKTDYNLHRVVKLARRAFDGSAAGLSVPVGDEARFLVADGFELGPFQPATAGCLQVYRQRTPLVLDRPPKDFSRTSPALRKQRIRSYVGMPVFSHDQHVIGTLAIVFGRRRRLSHDDLHLLNDYVRLIEDSLQMRQLNVRDPLTQLFNRRYVEVQARNEWRRAMRMQLPLSMAIADIDHFKLLNDTAGHDAGDAALIDVARILSNNFQRAGDSVCRHGGEEFSVLLPHTSADAAVGSMRKARQALRRHAIPHPGRANQPLTLSVGITTFETVAALESHDFAAAMRQADAALYAAKRGGRDRIMHYRELSERQRFMHLENPPAPA